MNVTSVVNRSCEIIDARSIFPKNSAPAGR
jgi:hypothetical protein